MISTRLLSEAEAHYRSGRYLDAVRILYRLLSADPEIFAEEARRYQAAFPVEDRTQFWSAPQNFYPDPSNPESVFTHIYEKALWGGGSGTGSDLRNTVLYIAYVQALMDRHAIRTVVDLGCGDWRFSRYLDFSGRDYTGYDVVASVISANTPQFGKPHIRFVHADIARLGDIPECDLVLCKDVLQHLSNSHVQAVLDKCRNARFVLVTNDYHPANPDCADGETRPLDISRPPFEFPARPVLRFGGKVSFLAGA